jgi:hypothetical protein
VLKPLLFKNVFNSQEQAMNPFMRFRINKPDVIYESFDNEVVIIDFETGSYYSLDKVGTDIWRFIEDGATTTEIVEAMTRRYKGTPEHIETAVSQLMAKLQQKNLIVPDEAKQPGSERKPNTQIEMNLKTEKLGFDTPILQAFTDMQELLLLDPIHEVDETGWPGVKPVVSDE